MNIISRVNVVSRVDVIYPPYREEYESIYANQTNPTKIDIKEEKVT